MFIKPLKFIGLILIAVAGLMLQASVSLALDTRGVTGYTEIYGDINVEIRASGFGTTGHSSFNRQEFIHYHKLGVNSYIWDPRLVQFNAEGNFYQNYSRGDGNDNNFMVVGGGGSAIFFPYSILPVNIRGSREQGIDPRWSITQGGADVDFLKKGWPSLYLSGSWTNARGEEKDFKQDVVYLTGSARFVYQVFFKPIRVRVKKADENGNEGNGNGNGGNGKNAKNGKEEEPGGGRLMIDISYDYRSTDDKERDIFTTEQRGNIFLGYFFNNNRIYILNYSLWYRLTDVDNYTDELTFFHQWSPTLAYNLGLIYSYNTQYFIDKVTTNDSQSVSAYLSLYKIFSPQWHTSLSATGHYNINHLKQSSWGAAGMGSIYSRVFPNFDWSASLGGGVENDVQHHYTTNYNAGLSGLYRFSPNKILTAEGTFTYLTGVSDTHGWEGRGRLTFDTVWSPQFNLRGIAEYRYQDYSQLLLDAQGNAVTNGKNQTGTADVYGLYRFTPYTSLYAGANFTYTNFGSTTDKFARAYATLSSRLFENLNVSLSTGYDYSIDRKRWSARVSPQIFYVWRQIYFSLWGEFIYTGENNNNDNRWNYYVNFKVSRPFSIKFF